MQKVNKGLSSCYIETGDGEPKFREFLLAYRTAPLLVTRNTPSELFLDRQIRTRLDVLEPMLSAEVKEEVLGKRMAIYNENMWLQQNGQQPIRQFNAGEKM